MTQPSPQSKRLAKRLSARFAEHVPTLRTLGREGEHPIVHADGTMADAAALWPHLESMGAYKRVTESERCVALEGQDHSFVAEVGRGTMEIVVGPCADLHGIREHYEAAMSRLVRAADAIGVTVLGYGVQPVSPPTVDGMTPKQRYRVLHDLLGDDWLWFTLTASDQVHVAVGRDEAAAATNLANLLTPVHIALCANSPILEGRPTGVVSAREQRMGRIHAATHRHGMPAGPIDSLAAWVENTQALDFLIDRRSGRAEPVGRPFGEWLRDQTDQDDDAWRAWQDHDHYIWHSARPRAHGTVELRSACQQPWDEHMAACALGAGIVCAHAPLTAWIHDLFGDEAWPRLRAWHTDVIERGLAAEEPSPGFVSGVIAHADTALRARHRDEAAYLDPLRRRLQDGQNPAQRLLACDAARDPMRLVEASAIRF